MDKNKNGVSDVEYSALFSNVEKDIQKQHTSFLSKLKEKLSRKKCAEICDNYLENILQK